MALMLKPSVFLPVVTKSKSWSNKSDAAGKLPSNYLRRVGVLGRKSEKLTFLLQSSLLSEFRHLKK
jgi:hypothetical protein